MRILAGALTLAFFVFPASTRAQENVPVTPLNERVLVVYNAASQDSADVARHYQKARNIPNAHLLGLKPSATIGMPGTARRRESIVSMPSPAAMTCLCTSGAKPRRTPLPSSEPIARRGFGTRALPEPSGARYVR